MKRLIALLLAAAVFVPFVLRGGDEPMESFLQQVRRRNTVATYAKLHGVLQHRRRGKPVVTMPVYFGVLIHPDRTAGQLIIDNDEGYFLGQSSNAGFTSVSPMGKKKSDKLGYVGVRAADLTMSFLFCKGEKEFEKEIVGGVVPCRVFLLDDPDHKEKIKVWISSEHGFPLQAEFTKYGEKEPYRLLEASGFTRKNDLYYVKKIRVEGPGWRTRIDFDADSAEVDKVDPLKPPQIIKKIEEK